MDVLREDLQKYLPNLFGLLYIEPDWDSLSQKINNKGIAQTGSYLDSHLYELIAGAKVNDLNALVILEYFDIVFREICTLPEHARKQLNQKALEILRTLTPDFKNYIGELAVLDGILKTGQFRLLQAEASLGNGKSAEYYIENIEQTETYYVEVVNIHLTESHGNLRKTLRRKIVHKINDKRKKVDIEIIVVPVIWASRAMLKKLHDAYNQSFTIKHAYEPFAFSVEPNAITGVGEHRFHRISNLFNKLEQKKPS